jgi:hypothetical protein
MTYVPGFLASKAAMDALRQAARSAPGLMVGVTIATTAVANVRGMGDAKANWNSLAKALEVEYPGLIGTAVFISRAGWIADDREAFLNAAAVFGGDLQKLSGLCYNLEGQVDQVRDAYAVYWMEIGVLAATVTGYVTAAQAMKMTAYMGAAGQLWLNRLTLLTNTMIAQKTKFLLGFLAVAGSTLAASSQSLGQLFNIQPTDGAAIDFERAVISTTPPSLYLAPERELPAAPARPNPGPAD